MRFLLDSFVIAANNVMSIHRLKSSTGIVTDCGSSSSTVCGYKPTSTEGRRVSEVPQVMWTHNCSVDLMWTFSDCNSLTISNTFFAFTQILPCSLISAGIGYFLQGVLSRFLIDWLHIGISVLYGATLVPTWVSWGCQNIPRVANCSSCCQNARLPQLDISVLNLK